MSSGSVSDLRYLITRIKSSEESTSEAIENPKELVLALEDLDRLVEMDSLKKSIVMQIQVVLVSRALELNRGSKMGSHKLHTVLCGPPGVGKTSSAKILARIWACIGLLPSSRAKEAPPSLYGSPIGARGIASSAAKLAVLPEDALVSTFGSMTDLRSRIKYLHSNYYTVEGKPPLPKNDAAQSEKLRVSWDELKLLSRELGHRLHNSLVQLKITPPVEEGDVQSLRLRPSSGSSSHPSPLVPARNVNRGILFGRSSSPAPSGTNTPTGLGFSSQSSGALGSTLGAEHSRSQSYSTPAQVRSLVDGLRHILPDEPPVSESRGPGSPYPAGMGSPVSSPMPRAPVAPSSSFVVCGRADLVAGFQGQSAEKTRTFLQSHRGKCIIIEEAYLLFTGERDTFGMEALTELNRFMDECSEEAVIIMTGYRDLMESTIFAAQPGLRRRCQWNFEVQGYSARGLSIIFTQQLERSGLKLDSDVEILDFFERLRMSFPAFGGDTERLAFHCLVVFSSLNFEKSLTVGKLGVRPRIDTSTLELAYQEYLRNTLEIGPALGSPMSPEPARYSTEE